MHTNDLKEFKSFAQRLASESAGIIRPYFRSPSLKVEVKADASPVTAADRGAEECIRQLFHKHYPAHGVIGEEFGTEEPEAEFVWIIDPIDGTIAFTTGCPLFGTLIGLLYQQTPVLGVINQPILEQFCIGDGSQTLVNNQPVRVRELADLEQTTLLVSDPLTPARYQNGAAFAALAQTVKVYRTWADCYGYLLLASGFADIVCDPIMNPWDLLPLIPVVAGAGGVITSWSGQNPVSADACVAASRRLHPQVIAILNR